MRNHILRDGTYKALFGLCFAFWLFLSFGNNAYAENYRTTISVNAEPYMTWQIETDELSTLQYPVSVVTNSPYGYALNFGVQGDNTDLESIHGQDYNIPSITLTSGVDSIPASSINNGYGYSLNGTSFKPIPTAGTTDLIANPLETTPNAVNTHNITFGLKVDSSYASGKYLKAFVVTAVANAPIVCESGYICYEKNGTVAGGPLSDQAVSSNTSVTLQAPNYKRTGYGFAGWNTMPDGTGTNYGPNETITVGDVSNDGLILFANWVQSAGDLQGWNGCEAMSFGDITALTDNRDGNTYAIVRMGDGGCWMMENLRLDLSDPDLEITAQNTNNPSQAFLNAMANNPTSSNSFCITNNAACIDQIKFNNNNIDENSQNYYPSYGAYYNWYTATAGHGLRATTSSSPPLTGDICPVGWSLPTGYGIDGDFAVLDVVMGGNGNNQTTVDSSNRWRKYPMNYIYNGQYKENAQTDVGVSGNYFSSEAPTNEKANNLWLLADKVSLNSNSSPKYRGQSVRCVQKKYYTVKYNSNVPNGINVTGTMADQKMARDTTKILRSNTFSHTKANHVWYRFLNWNTQPDGSGTTYTDGASVSNLAAAGAEITLYAQWEVVQYADLEVLFDGSAISEFNAENNTYGNATITTSGDTAEIAIGKTYQISFDLDVDYEFVKYTTTENGVLGSATVSPTTYLIISGNATLTIDTKQREHPLYIQNLDSSVCSSTPKLVTDIRDGEQYFVQRLADGNCWMIDDLRLGLSPLSTNITSDNTNISANTSFTLPAQSTSLTANNSTPQYNLTNSGSVIKHFGDTSGQGGTYYNYCAATAGTVCSHNTTVNATEDICPAGWRLPTGNAGGEQETLFNQFGSIAGMQTGASLTYAGWYTTANGGAVTEFETASWLWSSTGAASNKAYAMFMGRTKKSFNVGYFEYYGMNVRCVMK